MYALPCLAFLLELTVTITRRFSGEGSQRIAYTEFTGQLTVTAIWLGFGQSIILTPIDLTASSILSLQFKFLFLNFQIKKKNIEIHQYFQIIIIKKRVFFSI